MKKWKISSNDSGVSEVIGTILLLSISVTLFSVVYVSVLSFPGAPSIPASNIALSQNETSLIITHNGGEPLSLDSKIKIIIDDESYICPITNGLNTEAEQDNYFGFGEQFLMNFSDIPITFDRSAYNITVMVIDVHSNSLVLNGKSFITNRPPIIGSPHPYNTSQDVLVDIGQITITISDPDNDVFNWWIHCSNGQSAHEDSASNGIKTLSLSRLKLKTTYIVWVNATDPTGTSLYTRKSYTFTTEGNHPPTFGIPSPLNGATDISVSFSWCIPINDREGDLFSWTIQCSNGQTNNSAGQEANGTKSLLLLGLAYSTTYTVWVNATDPTGSNQYSRNFYTFRTTGCPAINTSISSISPYLNPTLPITAVGEADNVTLYYRWSDDNSSWTGGLVEQLNGVDSNQSNVDNIANSGEQTNFLNVKDEVARDGDSMTIKEKKVSGKYILDFEYQWITATYNMVHKEVCIYVMSHTAGTEALLVNYWTGSTWSLLGTIPGTNTAPYWYNFTATGLTSSLYTIQLKDATQDNSILDIWNIDVIILRTWNTTGGSHGQDWVIWTGETNPDTLTPWSWNFDFPKGSGYYEFYSLGKDFGYCGGDIEPAPVTADARCYKT